MSATFMDPPCVSDGARVRLQRRRMGLKGG
jgi:hypothetical protein